MESFAESDFGTVQPLNLITRVCFTPTDKHTSTYTPEDFTPDDFPVSYDS